MFIRRPYAPSRWKRPLVTARLRRRMQPLCRDAWQQAADELHGDEESVTVALVGILGLDELRAEHGRAELDRVRDALRDRLSATTRPSAVAVVADDTMLVAVPTRRSQPELANHIMAAVCEPVTIDDDAFQLCAAIGVAAGPADEATRVIERAEDRLRDARRDGGGTVRDAAAGLH
jgi:GGDEF domain-containing protein